MPATNIVATNIFATTETHSPVAVMCNSTTVRESSSSVYYSGVIYPITEDFN